VHNAAQPFRVVAGNQVIEDIGTAFNVNAYNDEPAIKTTLAEGALAVNGIKLSPGQQYANGAVHTVNVEEVTAWKNGYFEFNHADIKTIMKQLARWYDLEIVYANNVPEKKAYTGKIGRYLQLKDLLDGLSFFDIQYQVEGHRLIIK
jgi:ferric-dicitrate binding protein FerR (iron transport regulator)